MGEQDIMHRVMVAVSKAKAVIFRNNVGMGWIGKSQRFSKATTVHANAGDVLIRAARPLHAGLCNGSSDLIGIKPVVITPEHVGLTLGVFVAIETKTDLGGATPEQKTFLNRIKELGGLAGIARDNNDALAILNGPPAHGA